MEIPMNVKVQCIDGEAGHSICVVLDPIKDQVTHLVVKGNSFFSTDHLVPVDLVLETSHDVIKLRCSLKDLERMDPFTETEFIPDAFEGRFLWPYYGAVEPGMLAIEHERIPRNELAIHRGDAVNALDGQIGKVDEFLIDPANDSVTHLIMREGHLWGEKDITIPISLLDRIENGGVFLKLTKKQVEILPTVPVKRKS